MYTRYTAVYGPAYSLLWTMCCLNFQSITTICRTAYYVIHVQDNEGISDMAEGEDCDGAVTGGDEIEISGLWIICG